MQDRIAELESRLASVERRLSALEGGAAEQASPDEPVSDDEPGYGLVTVSSMHIGRSLLIFGGAYLLRAITDSQFVPTGVGILMGAAYAVFWLLLAYRRSADPAERTQAVILGAISIVLAMPLLVEAVNRFQLLSGTQSLIALTVYCILAFAVAAVRDLRSIAWLATLGGIATAGAVMIVSHSAIGVATFLMLLGIGVLWLVYRFEWMALQWFAAGGANAGVVALVALSQTDQWSIEPRRSVKLPHRRCCGQMDRLTSTSRSLIRTTI